MDPSPKSPTSTRSPSVASHATNRTDPDDLSNTMNRIFLSQDRRLSAAALPSPTSMKTPPTANSARRPSSSFTLRQTASSPRLTKRASRSSLSGASPQQNRDAEEQRPTPKKSISNLISGLREAQAQASMEPIVEPVYLTAPDVAKVYFSRELARLETADAETMVVLHDACYGHRFSRPKTTRGALSMIVERPERLHASVLGAATAFVRMGGHYRGETNAPKIEREVRDRPPFRIRKTARMLDITCEFVTNVHGTAWMGELRGMCNSAGDRLKSGEKELARESTTEGGEKRTLHEGDLYLCSESLNAFQGALGGVADAVDAVFDTTQQTKRAFVAVRPPGHHCSADYPSGFCWLNNVHVGLEYAAQTHGLTHAAIIDFDLHHGDGSQSITWDRNSKNNIKRLTAKAHSKLKLGPDIGYYSLHDINSYPCENGDDEKVQAASLCIENAHGQSIWNVHLQPWKTVDDFWQLYESRYKILLEKARDFLRHHTSRLLMEGKTRPKAAIFISAGFDASEWEGAGMQRHKVNVPTEFYARFTEDVVKLAQEEGTGCNGRVISVLEGGYSDRALCSGVLSHLSGLTRPAASPRPVPTANYAFDLDQHMLNLSLQNGAQNQTYNTQWWSPENLTALEMKVNPPPPIAPGGKKFRMGQQPTYATPTESFAYKVHDPERFARSISGTMRERPATFTRVEPTVREPEIDWVVATQELAKLLIPQDRQNKSCTPEELVGPKKVPTAPKAAERDQAERPRQLRTRAKQSYRENPDEIARADRRRTIADLPLSVDPAPAAAPAQARRSSRRSSMASTMSTTATEKTSDIPPVPQIATTTNGMQPPPINPTAPAEIQMNKTRVPPKSKVTTRAIPASAPVSPVATFRRQPLPPIRQPVPRPAVSQSPTPTSMSPNSEMDVLTKGLKKVTLKLGSREEHDRKMKEKLDAERRARALKGAETRRINRAAREAEMARSKITPAQRAKLGPEVAKVGEANVAMVEDTVGSGISMVMEAKVAPAAVQESTEDVLPVADLPKPQLAIHMEGLVALQATAPSPEGFATNKSTTAMEELTLHPSSFSHQGLSSAPPIPQPMPIAQIAPRTAEAQVTSTAPSFFTPSYQPPVPSGVLAPPPTMTMAPPQSTTLTSFTAISNETISHQSPQNAMPKDPSPSHHTSDVKHVSSAERKLPIFSSTCKIPFAVAEPAMEAKETSAGAVNKAGSSQLQGEMGVDFDSGKGKVKRDVWEAPETPER
jgi:histone deacetylase HOS3